LSSFQKSVRERNIIECKEFVQNYIEKVLVYPDRVEATFKIMLEGSDGYTVKSGISTKKLKKLATNIA